MNTNNRHPDGPVSPRRRLLITGGIAALVSAALTSCDDGNVRGQQSRDPASLLEETISGTPEILDDKIERANPYPLPNNHFEVLPTVEPLDPQFLERVEKITLEERKAHMIAVNGGGKASDEVAKLESLGLRSFDNVLEIQQAFHNGKLIALPSIDEGRYFAIGMIGEADPENKFWYHLINPDAYNRFNEFVAKRFYAKTGKMLKVGGLVRSADYQAKLRVSNIQASRNVSPHEFGRTIDFSIPQVFDPQSGTMVPMSPEEREFISRLLTYYEKNSPDRTSWLVENKNAYHGTHYPILKK